MGDRMYGKVAVITGAASGLGEASARRFAQEGARVVVADLQDDAGRAVAENIGDAATFVHCDVTDEAQVAAAVDLAVSKWGKLDVMFNNAGIIGAVGPIAEMPSSAWHRSIDVLLNSVFYGSKHAARVMIPNRSGSIIATSSIAGLVGGLGPHGYTAAKAAVIGFVRSLSAELTQHGIRVNAIAPGSFPTALTAQALSGDSARLDMVSVHINNANGPGFEADPIDIANAALYLASDEGRMVSGTTLVVDAGRSVNGRSTRFAESTPGLVDVALKKL
jgi:NAD(P)-dependent dehydrogenase (short-subunit alcohol dehydrogenase family)